MIYAAIVDDEESERRKLKACLAYVAEKKNIKFSVREFSDADKFLVNYESNYDVVFMDIEMDGTNGMEAARQLRKVDKTVILIFVTNMAQMAVQGYEVDALDFIVKPLDKYAFSLKMMRVLGRIDQSKDDRILLSIAGDLVSIRVSLITYLEVQGHYVIYHSKEGDYTEYITLSAAEKKIADSSFVRCNRGCLVNLRYVSAVRKDVCVVDGEELAIARPTRNSFIQAFACFLGGGNRG